MPNAPSTTPDSPTPRASSRRVRYLAQTTVLMLAITAACIFGVLLASKYARRYDVTATREHELSPRTMAVLRSIDQSAEKAGAAAGGGVGGSDGKGGYEIVITADRSGVDPRAMDRAMDVLEAFERGSKHVSVSFIDVTSARGQQQLDAVLARLTARYKAELDGAVKSLADAAKSARALSAKIDGAASELQALNDATQETDSSAAAIKRFFTDSATVARVASREVLDGAKNAETLMAGTIERTPIPPVEQAVAALRTPVGNYLRQLEQIVAGLRQVGESGGAAGAQPASSFPPQVRERAKAGAVSLDQHRDAVARLALDLDQTPRTPLESVVRVLTSTSAALVIGPPPPPPPSPLAPAQPAKHGSGLRGVTAIDIQALLPPRIEGAPSGLPQTDLRFRTEELLAGALASLSTSGTLPPIVCVLHAAPAPPEGERLAPDYAPLRALVMRLRLRGMEIVEWPSALKDGEPTAAISAIDPSHKRPVVYVVVPTNALSGADGALRAKNLADTVGRLVKEGRPLLVSLAPSNLPTIGQKDPMVEPLTPLGLSPDTAHPLLRRTRAAGGGGSGFTVSPDLVLVRSEDEHPVGASAQSLPTLLTWAMPIRVDPSARAASGSTIWPLLVAQADANTWGESDWLGFRQTPGAQRALLINPPAPDSPRDDTNGPWTVAAALERPLNAAASSTPPGSGPSGAAPMGGTQRLIVVASNGWFFDELTQKGDVVNGRPVPLHPGNLELFESSIYWLAGQESLIARSAEAQHVPLIPDLSAGTQRGLRWGLIAGMPLIVLVLGVLWRLLRG